MSKPPKRISRNEHSAQNSSMKNFIVWTTLYEINGKIPHVFCNQVACQKETLANCVGIVEIVSRNKKTLSEMRLGC